MIDLKTVLHKHPNCLASRSAFKSVLLDKYPDEKRMVNILTSIYECGMADKIREKSSITQDDLHMYVTQLELDYGTPVKYAEPAIMLWAMALGVGVLPTGNLKLKMPPIPSHDIYLVIDTSGGMYGQRIGALNAAIESLIIDLVQIENRWGKPFRLRILQFGTGATWQTSEITEVSEYLFADLHASGLCDLGTAYKLLDQQLACEYGETEPSRSPIVALFLLRDPTDDFVTAFRKLSGNPVFKRSKKIAFRMGSDTDFDILEQFTGHKNLVFSLSEMGMLVRIATPEGDERKHIYDELIDREVF